MQLLAAVDADGSSSLTEGLVTGLSRLRRGMTAVVITSSLDRGWIRPLTGLRGRGVACVVLSVDPASAGVASATRYKAPGQGDAEAPEEPGLEAQARALRYALAEHDLRAYRIAADRPLGEQLAG
jgi:hypothetical protein